MSQSDPDDHPRAPRGESPPFLAVLAVLTATIATVAAFLESEPPPRVVAAEGLGPEIGWGPTEPAGLDQCPPSLGDPRIERAFEQGRRAARVRHYSAAMDAAGMASEATAAVLPGLMGPELPHRDAPMCRRVSGPSGGTSAGPGEPTAAPHG